MPVNIVTQEDLEEFRASLLQELKDILLKHDRITLHRWIKSNSVMEKLEISSGTLQNLRVNGTIPYSRLGGIIYYDEEEIHKILSENKNFSLNDRS
ncbi:helix-turn-helix domain-containing protein [Muricauda sp. NFXS6]|uniref:helix-turn-helix domain-containing protein n=1 Tax=Allomuricauda sp. NFXS6 TaxID=2819094 RepID=UPI0032DFD388